MNSDARPRRHIGVLVSRLRRRAPGCESLERLLRWPQLRRNLSEQGVLIYSGEHGFYWREGAKGYVKRDKAGIWSIDEALALTVGVGPEKKIEFHSLF